MLIPTKSDRSFEERSLSVFLSWMNRFWITNDKVQKSTTLNDVTELTIPRRPDRFPYFSTICVLCISDIFWAAGILLTYKTSVLPPRKRTVLRTPSISSVQVPKTATPTLPESPDNTLAPFGTGRLALPKMRYRLLNGGLNFLIGDLGPSVQQRNVFGMAGRSHSLRELHDHRAIPVFQIRHVDLLDGPAFV